MLIRKPKTNSVTDRIQEDSREDKIASAIDNLGNKLENLRIEMDKREFGRMVSETTTEQRNDSVRGGGRRRIL